MRNMKIVKLFKSFSREKEIHDICKKYKIKDYTINDDLSIDVKGSVYLSHKELNDLPLTFSVVDGNFNCNYNKLTSLIGTPRKCKNFYCGSNNLTSLEGAPDECEYFSCSDNNLINLKGAPRKCKHLYCFNNNLTSLEGAPEECEYFDCENNNLINLKGAPIKCNVFYCNNNYSLRTLEYIPNIEYIDIRNTAVSSFEYLPNSFKFRSNIKLTHICDLICKDINFNKYILDEIELFNDYRIIDDKDYVNNEADKATLNMFKLKDFLEELKIGKEINIKELEKHFYIK